MSNLQSLNCLSRTEGMRLILWSSRNCFVVAIPEVIWYLSVICFWDLWVNYDSCLSTVRVARKWNHYLWFSLFSLSFFSLSKMLLYSLLPFAVVFIGSTLFALQQLSGINAVFYFSSTVFRSAGVSSNLANIFVGIANLLGISWCSSLCVCAYARAVTSI